ncbi:MAG: molybdate ABC transporter substrate-binding protein [Pseudomonadales bacterium]|nr:molybdate ABC transporter substrate-binding protein [Pseudomonadales bacterium]
MNGLCYSDTALIAVASNFSAPVKTLKKLYQKENDANQHIKLVFGSSGKLFAQIRNGAPFDAFLSADEEKPQKLINDAVALKESQFNYAYGRLALWINKSGSNEYQKQEQEKLSPKGLLVDASAFENILQNNEFTKFAIANPSVAPYGMAAVDVLKSLSVYKEMQSKLVLGENISQAYQFVASRNASAGLVAWSFFARSSSDLDRVKHDGNSNLWLVPNSYHRKIAQSAVLLKRGKTNQTARAFLEFLRSTQARSIIQTYGYDVEGD